MNKKLLYVSIFLIFVLFLSGCGTSNIITTPNTEEDKVKSVIYEYALAVSNQNWSKAQSYCVYGSDRYYVIAQIKEVFNTLHAYCNFVTINMLVNVSNVSINGNFAQAYIDANLLITGCGEVYSEQDSGTTNLQKVGNSWKLY